MRCASDATPGKGVAVGFGGRTVELTARIIPGPGCSGRGLGRLAGLCRRDLGRDGRRARLLRRRLARDRGPHALLLEAGDELAHLRVDDVAPAAAREDAVMSGAHHVVVELARLRDARAQAVRGASLAGAGD